LYSLLLFLNNYLPYAFPAAILALTPNRPYAVLRSTLLIAALCALIIWKIFGASLSVEETVGQPAWHDRISAGAWLLAAAFTAVVMVGLFFKSLTMVTEGLAARYLQYGGFLGPLVVLYWPAIFAPLSAGLAIAIAGLAAVHLWRHRKRPRIERIDTGYDPAAMLEKEPAPEEEIR